MKIAYYNYDGEKDFELQVDKYDSIDEKYVVKDFTPLDEMNDQLLNNLAEEIFILRPYNNGEDFYLKYFNHTDYFQVGDNNFERGSLISHTIGRNDPEENFVNIFRGVYKTRKKKEGILKYLNEDGKLIKYHHFRYFMLGEDLVAIHEDKTEVKMYRDSTLNNTDLGVAIIQDNKIVEVNETYANAIHRTREDLLNNQQEFRGMNDFTKNLVKKELDAISKQKKLVYKSPIVSYDANGELDFYLNAEASYITYDNLPAVLVKIFDLTEQEKYKRLIESEGDVDSRLQTTFNDLLTHSKTFLTFGHFPDNFTVSENFYEIIEDEKKNFSFELDTIRDFIIGEDLNVFDAMISSLSPSNPEVEFITRIMTLKFNVKYLRNHIRRIYDKDGKIKYSISAHQDITEETNQSNSLKKEIFEKNEIIKNKEIEIKEAHHNIKNNLNILLSLIRMEEHFDKEPAKILDETKTHISSISLMHEKLYQSETLTTIELKEYIDSIIESLLNIYSSKIKYISHVDDISLNAKQAGTLGLMVNEFINNTVKYAFPDNNPGTIELKISRLDKIIEVEYRDSGVGIPDSVDFNNPSTLGLIVIQNLTKQIDGKIEYKYDHGTRINLEFNEIEVF